MWKGTCRKASGACCWGENEAQVRTSTSDNHLLIFGQTRKLSCFTLNRHQLTEQARWAGALTFLPQSADGSLPSLGEKSFDWTD